MKAHLQLAQQQDGQRQKDTLDRIEDITIDMIILSDNYYHLVEPFMTSLNEHPEIIITDVVKSIIAQFAPTALERDIQIAFDYLKMKSNSQLIRMPSPFLHLTSLITLPSTHIKVTVF